MAGKHLILWAVLFILFLACAWWHIRENKQLSREWQKKLEPDHAHWMAHFAWSRTVQLLFAIACSILVIIIYDWQLGDTRTALASAQANEALLNKELQKQAADATQQIATLTQQLTVAQTTAQAPAPIATAIDDDTNRKPTLDDIYNPERSSSDAQSSMDAIKKRYEDILVTYFFLKKCNRVNDAEYNTITSALAQDMASVNAPGRMQYDILTAAKGSYNEIYAKSSCNDKSMATLYSQYLAFIRTLKTNFPAQ
jgi:hypothetical protein